MFISKYNCELDKSFVFRLVKQWDMKHTDVRLDIYKNNQTMCAKIGTPIDLPVHSPNNNCRPHYATFNPNEIMSSNETKLRANRLINGSIILSLIDRQFSTRWKLIAQPQEVFVLLFDSYVESLLVNFT